MPMLTRIPLSHSSDAARHGSRVFSFAHQRCDSADFDLLPDTALLDDRQIAALAGVKISTVKGWRRRVSPRIRVHVWSGAGLGGCLPQVACRTATHQQMKKKKEMPPALSASGAIKNAWSRTPSIATSISEDRDRYETDGGQEASDAFFRGFPLPLLSGPKRTAV